jgi:hypothetical protein
MIPNNLFSSGSSVMCFVIATRELILQAKEKLHLEEKCLKAIPSRYQWIADLGKQFRNRSMSNRNLVYYQINEFKLSKWLYIKEKYP